ncbi:MAG: hypothetical protein JNK05_13470 [Myxococcales bacterium]|nr:hypothetical protein [Myxococcales bacterium]
MIFAMSAAQSYVDARRDARRVNAERALLDRPQSVECWNLTDIANGQSVRITGRVSGDLLQCGRDAYHISFRGMDRVPPGFIPDEGLTATIEARWNPLAGGFLYDAVIVSRATNEPRAD